MNVCAPKKFFCFRYLPRALASLVSYFLSRAAFFALAMPDVIVREITYDCEFLLLACDGIWDVLSNQEVVDFCRDRIAAGKEPEQVENSICCINDCSVSNI